MELRLTSKNVEISDEVRQYLEKKLGKLLHHLPNITESIVEIAREKTKDPQDRYVVQITLNSRGTLLRGEERAPVLATAIDNVTNVLDRQIERFKGRRYEKAHKVGEVFNEESVAVPEEAEASNQLVKIKRFSVKPMSVDEAIEQMELLGHDFFLFLNINGQQFNVVYQRRDGAYGLIEPVIG